MTGIELWSTTASSNNSAAPNGWPEGMPPSGVNDTGRQMMAATREWYETAEWINLGHTPTYIGATQFSVTGDKTTTYQVGRRVKAYGTTPFTIYGTITVSAFSSVTTVTVVWDSGSLNGTLSTIWVGSASVTNPSISSASVRGVATNNSAASGYVGEYISGSGTNVSLTTGTAVNIATISLTAGDWNVWGIASFNLAGTTTATIFDVWTSTSSALKPSAPLYTRFAGSILSGGNPAIVLPTVTTKVSVSSTTTVYLSVDGTFAVSTATSTGNIYARRIT